MNKTKTSKVGVFSQWSNIIKQSYYAITEYANATKLITATKSKIPNTLIGSNFENILTPIK
jgi:hypothetical protein